MDVKTTGVYDASLRDKYITMDISEKRKLYKCRKNFLTLSNVDNITKFLFNDMNLSKKVAKPRSNVPILQSEDANFLCQKISVWRGDITTLEIDAIVNAANMALCGGNGVDGAIHSAAGPLLLSECRKVNGCPTGESRITSGYNLPAKYVIHTVGPTDKSESLLQSCYKSSLDLMRDHQLTTIAFPCIATGIYGFPNEPAARIALQTVMDFLRSDYGRGVERVIFTVFLEKDESIYQSMLQTCFSSICNK